MNLGDIIKEAVEEHKKTPVGKFEMDLRDEIDDVVSKHIKENGEQLTGLEVAEALQRIFKYELSWADKALELAKGDKQ